MKGFGIEIKNTLLEQKHIERMGTAVWLYMWFIDKITAIDRNGIGKVLGGKPIKYEEVRAELGIPKRTYRRWIATLHKNGYINTKRTPYGLIFSVNKAYKRFGNRYAKSGTSDAINGTSLYKSGTSNKTEQIDKTNRQEVSTKLEEISKELKSKLKW